MDKKLNFRQVTEMLKSKSWDIPKELVTYLSDQGHDLFIYPFRAEVGDETEKYEYTYENGNKAMLTRHFANVYQTINEEEKYIGRYELSGFKGARTGGTFCPIFRNGKWYALVSPARGLKIYSLPELGLVAETKKSDGYSDMTRITDIYCPRIASKFNTYEHEKEEYGYYTSWIDNEIELDRDSLNEWESAPFAFVESYDPYCSGTNYVRMVDLRNIENGELSYYKDLLAEAPDWLPLRQSIDISDWDKEFPSVKIAGSDYYSTLNGAKCEGQGWTNDQLDYFAWAGEIPDPRISSERYKREWEEWISSDEFKFLEVLLDVKYEKKDDEWKNTCYSQEGAIALAKSDPYKLKYNMLVQWKRGALINNAYLIHGLQYFLPDENIKEVLLLAADNLNGEYAKAEAIMILSRYYPRDKNIKKKLKEMKQSDNKYLVNQIKSLEKENQYDARVSL